MAADWTDFLKQPTKAAKQLHVTSKDVARGAALDELNATRQLRSNLSREMFPENYPHTEALTPQELVALKVFKQRDRTPAPRPDGTIRGALDILRHTFMRDEDAKNIAKGLALTGSVASGVAAPLLVPSAPILSAAAINAITGIPANLAFNAPEGIGQDAIAGAAMGAASKLHPLAALPAALAAYAATDIPEASAMPLHSLMKRLGRAGNIEDTGLYVNPTREELLKMWKDARKTQPDDSVVRLLRDLNTRDVYGVEGSSILHDDMRKHLKLPYAESPGTQIHHYQLLEPEVEYLRSLQPAPLEKAGGGAVHRDTDFQAMIAALEQELADATH